MPRIPRGMRGGGTAHVLNRSNAGATIFNTPDEYGDLIRLLDHARRRHEVDLLAFCVMPNHFHLVVRVEDSSRLSAMMQWWLTSHVRRYHKRRGSMGHVWQGRFKSFPVQEDQHLLTVLRYVLINPVRAGLAADAFDWHWSSLRLPQMVAPWPVQVHGRISDWLTVEDPTAAEAVRRSIQRGSPFGDERWQKEAAEAWGLESTIKPRGRPPKQQSSAEAQVMW